MWALFLAGALAVVALAIVCVAIAIGCSHRPSPRRSSFSSSRTRSAPPPAGPTQAGFSRTAAERHVGQVRDGRTAAAAPAGAPTQAQEVGGQAPDARTATAAPPTPALEVGGRRQFGTRKARRVLPLCPLSEEACEKSYAGLHLVRAARVKCVLHAPASAPADDRSEAAADGRAPKSVGPTLQACDAHVASVPRAFFSRQHGRGLSPPGPRVERYLVAVGINYVGDAENRLTSCWNDVEALRGAFERRHGAFSKVWTLSDNPQLLERRAARTPTAANLRAVWRELLTLAQRAEAAEIVLVYSGHGTFRLTSDVSELTGQSDALIFLDMLYYDYDVMADLVRPLPGHARLLIIFDSCNSGSAANLPWTYNPLSRTVNQMSLHTDLTNDVVMIAGCRDEQTSAAGPTERDPSECTRVLLEVLRDAPQPGSLPFTELVARMRLKLVAANDTQIPQLSFSRPQLLAAKI
jgi:Caspase domain